LPVELRHAPVAMRLEPGAFHALQGADTIPAGEAARRFDGPVTAVAGMGNPGRFFRTLRGLGLRDFEERPFPDHHDFSAVDFDGLSGTLLMTEKDAVKCGDPELDLDLPNAWALRVDARLPADWEARWVERIEALISENT
jgi:tetraacyldisaccharide 4'-kinase